jgi:predicted glycogen debranching enzyme
MAEVVRRLSAEKLSESGPQSLLEREWLVTNGLGGYSCGTLAGPSTRRYHGLLIAALPAPAGRRMMLNHVLEQVRFRDMTSVQIGGEQKVGDSKQLFGADFVTEFRLEIGLPVWTYRVRDAVLRRRIFMSHQQNTVFIRYELQEADFPLRLKLRPALHFRSHDEPVSQLHQQPYRLLAVGDRLEISGSNELSPPLRLHISGPRSTFTIDGRILSEVLYRVEESRGYESEGTLWSPGHFRVDLVPGGAATLLASTEPWPIAMALSSREAMEAELERRQKLISLAAPQIRTGFGAELVLAADQFMVTPCGRMEDGAQVHAAGDELRSLIAGYHWFTDWGRDTMISLEGLALVTGRHVESGYILRTFSHYIRDGLIPNLFPEGEREGLYHTADATLWYFHAIDRYVEITQDWKTLERLLPKLIDIVEHHLRGTKFGIAVDPIDGLLRQGEEGFQLTWMDAKVGEWVVTPRRGKAVEINALWYNALRLLQSWIDRFACQKECKSFVKHAENAYNSFNRRFWYEKGEYLFDVVDGENGDDYSCRPNQIIAISLRHPVLKREFWAPVLHVVEEKLLTPLGLRTLAPGSPDYKPMYFGDLRSRDAAYHQGTVWPWLIGPFINAWLKVHPREQARARTFLNGFASHLDEACVGTICEIFDAEPPFVPRGCIAQAWSVAEVLRVLANISSVEREPRDAPNALIDVR